MKDLTSVQNLQKKHTLLEADVASHQDRIEGIKITADQFVDGGHFDADNIRAKQVCTLFHALKTKAYLFNHLRFRLHCVIVIHH